MILWNFDRKITRKLRAKFTALEPERIESLRTYLLNRWAKSAREKGPAYVKANRIYWNSERGSAIYKDTSWAVLFMIGMNTSLG